MPSFPELSETDLATLSTVIDTRRDLLRQIATLSNSRVLAVEQLQKAQTELLEQTISLQTLLDENLLWVRSILAAASSGERRC